MSREYPVENIELDRRLAALSREQAPARDLWPGIVASMTAGNVGPVAPRRRWPLALAAGVAGAMMAGLIGWQAGREAPTPVGIPSPAGSGSDAFRESRFAAPEGRDYRATRAELETTYRERLALLAPATRARIEQDLATIREANADIRRALATGPPSAVLNRLLESTWQQEFDLYATVARSTAPAVPRSRT
jgi:hypothetical protein